MAETGFIEPPFRIVQSYRKKERRGRPAAVPVELGIETFYKVYRAARPAQVASDEQRVVCDPARFRTARMRAIFTEARRFAHLNVPILIFGERSTGKTTLARWIGGEASLHSPLQSAKQLLVDDRAGGARWPFDSRWRCRSERGSPRRPESFDPAFEIIERDGAPEHERVEDRQTISAGSQDDCRHPAHDAKSNHEPPTIEPRQAMIGDDEIEGRTPDDLLGDLRRTSTDCGVS
jgi:hypothetical protein